MIYVEKEEKFGNFYHSFCTDNLGKKYYQWLVPVRILGITPAEYVRLLQNEFNAEVTFKPETNFLLRRWENQADCRRWRLYINKIAREKGFHI